MGYTGNQDGVQVGCDMNIIIVERDEIRDGKVFLCGARARHVREVLQKQRGDTVRLGVLNGPLAEATIIAQDGDRLTLLCAFQEEPRPDPVGVDLILAMPRPKVMRRLWPQLTALGVGRIRVVNAEKVERYYFDSTALNEEAIRTACIEGLQQCGCTRLPDVSIHMELKPLIEDQLTEYVDKRIAVPGAVGGLHEESMSDRVLLAIGPEGGWTSYERELFRCNGFREVGMGTRILRSDTACIAAVALLRDALA